MTTPSCGLISGFLRARSLRLLLAAIGALGLAGAALAQSVSATFVPSTTTLSPSGGTVTLTATINFPGKTLSTLGWTMQIPAGWSHASSAGTNLPPVRPTAGQTAQLEWAYIDPTTFSGTAQFTTTISYPAGLGGNQIIRGSASYKESGAQAQQSLVTLNVADVVFALPTSSVAITAEPVGRTVAAGSAVAFSVTATGTNLSYQWRKGGSAIAGATSSTYTIAAVQTSDAGSYDVVVSSGSTSAFSSVAVLSVTTSAAAPTISMQPVSTSASVGGSAAFSVGASANSALTYQWRRNGVPVTGATQASYTIASAQTTDAGSYDVVITSSGGSITSSLATLAVISGSVAPSISSPPSAAAVSIGATATFSVTATGTPTLTYQWRKNGTVIAGATSSSLVISSAQPSDAGNYDVVVTNSAGSVTSTAVALTVSTGTVAPSISAQPVALNVAENGRATFSVTASGNPSPTFQWRRSGAVIVGATNSTLVLANVQSSDAVSYDVVVTNSAGSATSNAATLTVLSSRLVNASVRCLAGSGDQTLIVGFILRGAGARQILLRGIGPTLAQFGVTGALADPRLRLFNFEGAVVTENDDWGGVSSLSAAFAQAGAFALPPASKDAAILIPLAPGNYTAHVTSVGASGVALVEAYDADSSTPTTRIANLSVRTQVGTGENILVVGFVISGNASRSLLVRGIGPTLAQFGVNGALTDPQLRLIDSHNRVVQQNDDWGGTPALTASFAQVAAFALPNNSKDAALAALLAPGAYTVEVSGVGGATGVALVELYELP
jgi:hypothetical protein